MLLSRGRITIYFSMFSSAIAGRLTNFYFVPVDWEQQHAFLLEIIVSQGSELKLIVPCYRRQVQIAQSVIFFIIFILCKVLFNLSIECLSLLFLPPLQGSLEWYALVMGWMNKENYYALALNTIILFALCHWLICMVEWQTGHGVEWTWWSDKLSFTIQFA